MKTALIIYLDSTTWPRSCPLLSPAAEKFCLMAVEVAPLSVTYPSELTTYLVVGASWRCQKRAFIGLVVQSSTVIGVEKIQIKPRTPRRWSD